MSVARIEDREVTPRFLDDDDVRQLEALFAEVKRLRRLETAVCTMSGTRSRGLSQLLRGWAANIVSADGICVRSAWLNAIADAWEAK